jgi:hypothetical protein
MRENTRGYRRKTVNLHVELVSDVYCQALKMQPVDMLIAQDYTESKYHSSQAKPRSVLLSPSSVKLTRHHSLICRNVLSIAWLLKSLRLIPHAARFPGNLQMTTLR